MQISPEIVWSLFKKMATSGGWRMESELRDRRNRKLLLSLVVPMYNEAEACRLFFDRTIPILEQAADDFEIICVNDGSTDDTPKVLVDVNAHERRVKVLNLARNFGKEAALTAGIDQANGDAVILMDADLQDPPELIPDMIEAWRQGLDSVIAVRNERQTDSFMKRLTAKWFYRLIGRLADTPIPENAGDFRLLDRSVVQALMQLPERTRFMKGLYGWVGFTSACLQYVRPERVAGRSKFRFRRLWRLALEGIFSFTTLPLRIWTYLGFMVAALAGFYGLFIIVRTLIYGVDIPGYASLLVTLLFLSGLNMIGLGILGEYVGRIFIEVKQRPLYLVASRLGFDD